MPTHAPTHPHDPENNAADERYLAQTLVALDIAVRLSGAAAVDGSTFDVRALARRARKSQRHGIRRVSDLVDGRRTAVLSMSTPVRGGAVGPEADGVFVRSLTAHAQDSLARARVQMVSGVGRGARQVAEDAIREHSHELAAIGRLVPATAAVTARPATR